MNYKVLSFINKGIWILIGYCQPRKTIRNFALHRIINIDDILYDE
ncbi:MAG TPA: hypothetical protein PLM71_11510 [Syntrophorhabdaceae bacterium]|nr:hypothetical protein [Syntrophorhabdaceae bacterium]